MGFDFDFKGHGAALNADGDVELDAIIMDGRTLSSGAVSSLKNIPAPVSLARAVMEKVLLLNPPHLCYHEIAITWGSKMHLMTIPDSAFALDWQRCEPVCREPRHGHRLH